MKPTLVSGAFCVWGKGEYDMNDFGQVANRGKKGKKGHGRKHGGK